MTPSKQLLQGSVTKPRILLLRLLLVLGSGLLVASCSGEVEGVLSPTPDPTREILTIGLAAEVAPVQVALDVCIEASQAHVIVEPLVEFGAPSQHDLIVTLDQVPELFKQSAQIAEESLVVVTSSEDASGLTLPAEGLQFIYSGRAHFWSEIPDGDKFGNGPIGVWNYPEGHPLRERFEAAVFPAGFENPPVAFLAPNPEQMVQGVSENPGQIGYIPEAWTQGSVQVVQIEETPEAFSALPVLIASRDAITGESQAFISCMQTGPGQEALADIYPH